MDGNVKRYLTYLYNVLCLDEGLVSLNVDDNIIRFPLAFEQLNNFQTSFCPVRATLARHHHFPAKLLDFICNSLVICRHHQLVEAIGTFRVRVGVINHRVACSAEHTTKEQKILLSALPLSLFSLLSLSFSASV